MAILSDTLLPRDDMRVKAWFASPAALMASGATGYATGDEIDAGGYRYRVAAPTATDHHLTTASLVKLYLLFAGEIQAAALYAGDWGAAITMASATTITAFAGGRSGQTVVLVFGNGNTTLQHSSDLRLRGAVDFTPPTSAVVTVRYVGGIWREINRLST